MKTILPMLPASLAALALSACSNGGATVDSLARFSVGDLLPSRVPVVEVDEDRLEKLPLGAERALAFERKRDERRLAAVGPPATFREPVLPEITDPQAGFGVLPPRPQ